MNKINQATIDLIKVNEGCILHAYQDMVGVWTIGYGHIEGVKPGDTLTQAQAEQLLADDLNQIYGPPLAARLGSAPTTDNQFGAMLSLEYNVGVGGVAGSTVMREHLAGNFAAAADAFLLWDEAGGHEVQALLRRRGEERALYLTPDIGGLMAPGVGRPNYPGDSVRRLQAVLGVTVDGDWGKESESAWQSWRTKGS